MLCKNCKQNERSGIGTRLCKECGKKRKTELAALRRIKKREENKKFGIKNGRKICSLCNYSRLLSEYSTSLSNGKGKRNKICDRCLTRVYTAKSRQTADTQLSEEFWRKKAYSVNSVARQRLAKEKGIQVKNVSLADLNYICKPQHLADLYLRQDGRCAYCKVELNTPSDISVDHILPLSRAGSHAQNNLALACVDCNHLKHTRTAAEFLQFIDKYIKRFASNRTAE